MWLRQNENQCPSESVPGGAILAARGGKTQIPREKFEVPPHFPTATLFQLGACAVYLSENQHPTLEKNTSAGRPKNLLILQAWHTRRPKEGPIPPPPRRPPRSRPPVNSKPRVSYL